MGDYVRYAMPYIPTQLSAGAFIGRRFSNGEFTEKDTELREAAHLYAATELWQNASPPLPPNSQIFSFLIEVKYISAPY
jgi:hypothetical protein